MKSDKKLNKKILLLTLKISNDYPELLFYLNEMPITIPAVDCPEINTKILREYYNSLENLLQKYAYSHEIEINNLKKTYR